MLRVDAGRMPGARPTLPRLEAGRTIRALAAMGRGLRGIGGGITLLAMQLRIEGLSKRYPNGVQALKDVSLAIGPGMFGLLGPNGAGKSTLMRTIATLQEADSGSVRLGDVDVLRDKDQVRRVLGYLPQEFGMYPKVSAQEMLDHFATLKGIRDGRTRRDVVGKLLRQTNLYEVRKQAIGGFSGGMKQRFGIAQALLGNPRLIIVDEPTAGLDPEERVRFHNLLADIGEDVIVILSTHIVSDVSDLCHAMAVIHEGQVRLTGEPAVLVEQLAGRVFERLVDKAALPELLPRHRVLTTRLFGGRTRLRVHADGPPEGFTAVDPELEDVYFATIKGFA